MIGLSVHVDQYVYVFMLSLSLLIQEKLVFATVLDNASGLTPSSDGDGGNSRVIQPNLSSTAKPIRSADSSNDVVRTLSALESGLRSTWEASVRCLVEAFPVYCPQSPPACSLAAFEALFGTSSSKA